MKRLVGTLACLALLVGCGGADEPYGLVAFDTLRDGDFEIFLMNPDGTGVRQLTANDDDDSAAAWSPDGNSIAFMSDRDGDFEIFVMNADGTQARQLTYNEHTDLIPVWSPDGQFIAFNSDRYSDDEIFVMDADGSNVYSTGQSGWPVSWGG